MMCLLKNEPASIYLVLWSNSDKIGGRHSESKS